MKADRAPPYARLDLQNFVPFRLNRLAAAFSAALAEDYGARFGLDIPEWRVLATLGPEDLPRPASFVVRSTRTHKSRISRAVAHLTALGLVARTAADGDKRETNLALTGQGRRVYEALVPRMLAREADLLRGLNGADRQRFGELLTQLEGHLGFDAES